MTGLISIVAGLFGFTFILKFLIQPYLASKRLRELGLQVSFSRLVKDSYSFPVSLIEECAFLLKEYEVEFTYEDILSLLAMRRDDYQEAIRYIVGVLNIQGKRKFFSEALIDYARNK